MRLTLCEAVNAIIDDNLYKAVSFIPSLARIHPGWRGHEADVGSSPASRVPHFCRSPYSSVKLIRLFCTQTNTASATGTHYLQTSRCTQTMARSSNSSSKHR